MCAKLLPFRGGRQKIVRPDLRTSVLMSMLVLKMNANTSAAPNYQADRIAKLDAAIAALEALSTLSDREANKLRELRARRAALG
jgi:hypothetical protein